MKRMECIIIILTILISTVSSVWKNTDVALNVNKASAYLGESGITIRCESISQVIVNPKWMMILLEVNNYQRPLVYLSRSGNDTTFHDVMEWSEEFNVTDLKSRITVSGSLNKTDPYLQIIINKTKDEDSGKYTCFYGGYDRGGNISEFHTEGDFYVKHPTNSSGDNSSTKTIFDKDVVMSINKLSVYVGEKDVRIRCEALNNVITDPEWMMILMEGYHYQRPLIYLSKKNNHTGKYVFEWGQEFNVSSLQDRIQVSGHLNSSASPYLQLDFNETKCEDGGRYTCLLGGLDKDGRVREFSTAGDLIMKTLNGPPTVLDRNNTVLKTFTDLYVRPGEKVYFRCEGIVGRPKIPILWYELKKNKARRVLGGTDGTRLGIQELRDDDLCRFHSQVHLNYTMPNSTVSLTCKIAYDDVTVHLHPSPDTTLTTAHTLVTVTNPTHMVVNHSNGPKLSQMVVNHTGGTNPSGISPSQMVVSHTSGVNPSGNSPSQVVVSHTNGVNPSGNSPSQMVVNHTSGVNPSGSNPSQVVVSHTSGVNPPLVAVQHSYMNKTYTANRQHRHINLMEDGIPQVISNKVTSLQPEPVLYMTFLFLLCLTF